MQIFFEKFLFCVFFKNFDVRTAEKRLSRPFYLRHSAAAAQLEYIIPQNGKKVNTHRTLSRLFPYFRIPALPPSARMDVRRFSWRRRRPFSLFSAAVAAAVFAAVFALLSPRLNYSELLFSTLFYSTLCIQTFIWLSPCFARQILRIPAANKNAPNSIRRGPNRPKNDWIFLGFPASSSRASTPCGGKKKRGEDRSIIPVSPPHFAGSDTAARSRNAHPRSSFDARIISFRAASAASSPPISSIRPISTASLPSTTEPISVVSSSGRIISSRSFSSSTWE